MMEGVSKAATERGKEKKPAVVGNSSVQQNIGKSSAEEHRKERGDSAGVTVTSEDEGRGHGQEGREWPLGCSGCGW